MMVLFGVGGEGWAQTQYLLARTSSLLTIFYYLPIVMIGGFMLQNMNIAIIKF